MQIFNFRDGHVITFRHRSGALYLPNARSQTLQTGKWHTFRVSAFHGCHRFGVKLFSLGCVQDSGRVPQDAKNAVFGSGSAHATKFRNFSRYHPSSPPLWRFAAAIAAIRRLYIGLRVRYKYYRKHSCFGFSWSRPLADRGLSRPKSVFRTTIGVWKILFRSVEIWQYEGQTPVFE